MAERGRARARRRKGRSNRAGTGCRRRPASTRPEAGWRGEEARCSGTSGASIPRERPRTAQNPAGRSLWRGFEITRRSQLRTSPSGMHMKLSHLHVLVFDRRASTASSQESPHGGVRRRVKYRPLARPARTNSEPGLQHQRPDPPGDPGGPRLGPILVSARPCGRRSSSSDHPYPHGSASESIPRRPPQGGA
jgi:hypothetical protein